MSQQRSSLLTESLISTHEQQKPEQPKEPSFLSIFRFSTNDQKIYMTVGAISSMMAGLTFPFFLMYFGQITSIFVDPQKAIERGLNIMIKFVIIGAVYWVMTFFSLYCWSYSGSTQSVRLKKLYYQTLLQQQVGWYDSIDVGKLAAKIAKNISVIQNAIGQKVALLISAAFTSAFGILFAFINCWQLSLFLVVILPVIIYCGFLLIKSHSLRAKINNASYQQASGIAEQAFSGIRTIKYLVGQQFEVGKFQLALQKGNKKAVKYIALVSVFVAVFYFVQVGIYSIGMWFGKQVLLWNVDTGKYTASDIVGTFFCVVVGGSAFGQISPILKNLAEGKVAFGQMLSLMNRKKTLIQNTNGKKIKNIKNISLNKIDFKYIKVDQQNQQTTTILEDIDMKFLPNSVNAIVGESGCGKSTIVQLLLRYYDCTGGSIKINGTNIKQININNFRRKIGFVGQQPVLFAMSIEDNLKIANSKLTQQEIEEALKKANAWEFVCKLQKGIKTYVGSGGTQLSGGQKQRIAIARAICKNPQLLILDQATSALDRKNQKQIQMTLQNLQNSNITTIVIAHRLSTVKNAKKIFVLQKGHLQQQGSHEQLIKLDRIYARLVQTQLQAEQKGTQKQEQSVLQSLIQNSQQKYEFASEIDEGEEKVKSPEIQKSIKGTKQIQKQQKQSAVFRKLLKLSKPHLIFLIIGGLSSLINGAVVPFFSVAFGNILGLLNDVVANEDQIDRQCLYFFIIALIAAITTFLYNFNFAMVGDKLVHDLRIKTFAKLLAMPINYYDKKQNTPGAISTKLSNEAYQIHNMITGIVAIITLNSTTVAIGLLISLFSCWKITFITLAFTPFLMIATSISVKIIKRMSTKSERSQKLIGSLISDTVSNIRTVKSFGRSTFFIDKFEEGLTELNKVAFQKAIKISFFQGMRRAIIVIAQGVIIWIASILFYQNIIQQNSQQIYVAIFAIIYCSNTVGQSSQHLPDIARARRSGAILFDILESKDQKQISEQEGGILKDQIQGKIQFKNVTFKYPERDNIILDDFSLSIDVGQKIGLVGESGSGKSTVAQLLMRIYKPISGQILIDGKNIKQFDLYSYRMQLGLVNQEPSIFLGTVADNIRYNTAHDEAKFQKVLEQSCCSTFIQDWQEGLEKQVGQKGSQISGGQKQRVAIARCLFRKPKLYLFDESTSALDSKTQKLVLQNIKPVLTNSTVISIAHRLSTIEDANKIVLMRDGKIIESGNFDELIKQKGSFYKMAYGYGN